MRGWEIIIKDTSGISHQNIIGLNDLRKIRIDVADRVGNIDAIKLKSFPLSTWVVKIALKRGAMFDGAVSSIRINMSENR